MLSTYCHLLPFQLQTDMANPPGDSTDTPTSPNPLQGFVNVADLASLSPGQCRTVEVRGKRYALCNVEGSIYAVDDACPHRGGPLGAGVLEGHEVFCPLHGWPFDVRTGHCSVAPERPVRTHATRVQDGAIWMELPIPTTK